MNGKVLFCPPTFFDVIDVKNPFMRGAAPVDRAAARRQWEALRRAFEHSGCELHQIEPVPGLEDMVFANNQVFVGRDEKGKQFIIPSRMRHESRRREVPYFVDWFRSRGYEVVELGLPDGEFLEGHGDLLWDLSGELVWAGYGFRSTRLAIERCAAALETRGIAVQPLELADERFYHLDTCLAPLRPGGVLIYPGAFSRPALEAIHRHAQRVYEVSEEEALGFICNGVAVPPDFITPRLTPALEAALAEEDLRPQVVGTAEFEKSGGSVCCLKLFI